MSVISTYLNDNAQTPLNRFVVYMLYKQVCNKHGEQEALLWQRDRATRLSVEILQKHPISKLESRAYRVALFA